MRNSGSAVFGRLFLFAFAAIIIGLSVVSFSGCGSLENDDSSQPSEYFITFVLNNGEDNVVWRKGNDLPTPTKVDCEFLHWCKDEELTLKADLDFENLILEQNLTLYAKWKEFIDLEGVVFADVTCVYDGEAHSVKVDESTLPDGATVTYEGENSFVNAGEYVVTATVKADGYKDLVVSATLKIAKAKLVGITFPKGEVEWDGNKHSVFINYASGELPSEVKVTYDGNGQAEVGNHTVTAKFEVSDNYEPIADMTTLLVIKEKYFNVTFDDGISDKIILKVAHGQTLTDIPNPTPKDGYSARWNIENFENVLADVNVKAIYTPIEYTISFISDDSVVATKKYNVEKSVDFDNISKQHYVFRGWYDNENCSGESVTKLSVGNFGDKRFYAKWSAIEYFVTYHVYGGTNAESNTNCEGRYKYTVESDSLLLGAPLKSNYTFGGWYVSENFEGEPVEMIVKGASGNFDLYAKWIACEYSITYDYRDGESCDNPLTYTVESEDIALSASRKFGYDFVGWFDGAGNKIEVIRKGSSGNLTLYAEWSAIEFSVILNGANGSYSTTLTYTVENESVTLPKITRTGYTLAGWFDEDGNKYETVSGSAQKNISLTAKWNAVSYAITYEYDGGSQVDNPTSYTIEDEIVFIASEKDGYVFDGWFNGENKVEKIEKGSYGDVTLTAHWTKRIIKSDFVIVNGVLIGYTGANSSITVPSSEAGQTVTSVAATAFDSVCASVTQIVIEEGVQSIEIGAFDRMTNLKTLSIPSTISTLHRGMLKDCASLENLTIPFASFVTEQSINDVATDENAALFATPYEDTSSQCYALGFTYLFGRPANEDLLSKYTNVNGYYKDAVNNAVSQINSAIDSYVPNSLKYLTVLGGSILKKGFANIKSLQYVVLKDVSVVEQQAFIKCSGLKEVKIESEKTTFGSAVFSNCSYMTIYVASQAQKKALDTQIESLDSVECKVASN
ncbi:MAG TPA: hypothetical protein DEF02_01885 [Clostridiales bacterium]|nr:hypothetical protein [Clostridiales bacterium]